MELYLNTMSEKFYQDASFVVRIFWERHPQELLRWRGQVIHASTQQSVYFEKIDDLHEFIHEWTGILHSNNSS